MADIAAVNWNETDASNSAAAPDGAPEGMMSSGVNNVLRAHQGALKRFWRRSSVMVTTGTAGAYLVTHTVPPAALADGECELISFHAANTAGATLNVGALGAVPLHYYAAGAWRLIPNDLWGANFTSRVAYNAAAAAYRLLDLPDRTGEVTAFAGGTAPHGSLLCYGQAISRTAYAGLFAALGTAFGVGDGTSTFNLIDMRGQVAAGMSNMGGSDAGNLTGGFVLGAGLGEQVHTLTEAEMPAHTHAEFGVMRTSGTVNFTAPGPWTPFDTTTGSTGGNFPHNNVQPTRVLNYIIRV
jgi:microcystin-dependent protein